MYWLTGSSCIDFFKLEWNGMQSWLKLSVYFMWIEITVTTCSTVLKDWLQDSVCWVPTTDLYLHLEVHHPAESCFGKVVGFLFPFLKPHMLLLHERYKAEMILQSTGNYAKVTGKGKMKKCGTLNSNVKKKQFAFFLHGFFLFGCIFWWKHSKCLPPWWTNLFLKIWPTLTSFT